jgi:hypothetical protein
MVAQRASFRLDCLIVQMSLDILRAFQGVDLEISHGQVILGR